MSANDPDKLPETNDGIGDAGMDAGGTSAPGGDGSLTKEEKTFGMLCHLLALSGFLIPLGNIIAPLVIWMIKKEESEFVNYHGKESLNFQITVMIAAFIVFILCFVLIGFLLIPVLCIAALIFIIIAGLKANEGEYYQYKYCIRFLK